MKYYEIHDDIYKDLKKRNVLSWDGVQNIKNILDSEINCALNRHLNKYFPKIKKQKVLDLGTGTGNSALFLASKGFNVTGYDLSETAINMAIKNAALLGLEVDFFVQDLLKATILNEYDLIVDSSFLHCVVYNEERKKIYESIRKALKKNGHFFIHTMIQTKDMDNGILGKNFFIEDEIIWSVRKDNWDVELQDINGGKMFPHRKILNLKNLEKEFSENGFLIVDKQILDDKIPTYIAWLKKL